MTPYIPVQGTHAWDEDPLNFQWWEPGSAFTQYLQTLGLALIDLALPFLWSTELDGVGIGNKQTTWKGAGHALRYFIGDQFPMGLPFEKRNVIAHSHGGQVVFYACAHGLKLRNLITVGTPVRGDMEKIVKAARPNIGYWLHICDSKHDFTSLAGALFDGTFRVEHEFDLADRNDNCKDLNINHSKILNEPSRFGLWQTRGWATALARA